MKKAHVVIWMATSLVCLSSLLFWAMPSHSPSYDDQAIPPAFTSASLEDIGMGPLSLRPAMKSLSIPDLSQDVIVLARASRPGLASVQSKLLVTLRGQNQERVVSSGEQIFLEKVGGPTGVSYTFSDHATPLWVRPIVHDGDDIRFEVGMFTPSKKNEDFFEEVSHILLQQVRSTYKEKAKDAASQALQQSKWWGQDLLFKTYGGKEFAPLSAKHKLEIPSDEGSYVVLIGSGDYLQFKEGIWVRTELADADPTLALARVKAISLKAIEIEVWDEKGFSPQNIRLDAKGSKVLAKNEMANSLVRMRSSSQVAWTLGKRRLILKEGDWLLKVGRSWRNLKSEKEIDDCLQHRLRGELFIFDEIEKQQGKMCLKGHLFDEMRVQMTEVSIPIAAEGTTSGKNKKGRQSSLTKKKDTGGK